MNKSVSDEMARLKESVAAAAIAHSDLILDIRRYTNALGQIRWRMLRAGCTSFEAKGETCRTDAQRKDNPPTWCHVCSVLWMVEEGLADRPREEDT